MAKKKRSRRARGTGTIFQRADGVWVGRKTVDGRRIERQGRSQAEVIRKLEAASPPGPEITLRAWWERWAVSHSARDSTRAGYAGTFATHVLPHLGGTPLRDLTPGRVERFASDVGKTLHPNTVRRVLSHLGTVLSAAVREGLIPRNPVTIAKKPRGTRKVIDPIPAADLARVVAEAVRSTRTAPVALMAATGMRIGEVLALDVTDWDPVAGTLSITRTYTRTHGLRAPKTPQGVRTIRVPLAARPALDQARGTRTSGPLFATRNGTRRDRESVADAWDVVQADLGMAPRRNPHQLRHSVATALLGAGYPVGDVARYLGDRPETIYRTYCHSSGRDPSEGMDRLIPVPESGGKVGPASTAGRKT